MTSDPQDAATTSVLVIEDDPTVAEIVVRYLEREGFDAAWEADGAAGLDLALSTEPDLIVLDLMLPSMDGLTICRRLRETMPVPIVMLTALGEETDRVLGLELGADDYLTKPFSPRELVARIKAVLRRARGETGPPPVAEVIHVETLVVDIGAREAKRGDEVVQLTAREFDLLAFLISHPRQAFRREELLDEVWGYSYGDASTVTVHIRRLREKIEDEPSRPRFITTVWGVGYRWDQ
jgi:DNA-binding response OmpR family regulator